MDGETGPDLGGITPEQAIAMIDDDPTGIPEIPLQPMMVVWAIEQIELPGETGLIITFASPAFPRGIPFVIDQKRARKLASQIRKAAEGTPTDKLTVVKRNTSLILPGGG